MKQDSAKRRSPRSTDELLHFLADAAQLETAMAELDGEFTAPSFPECLEQQMRRHRLSIAELGAAAQLSRSFMYQIHSGDRSPGRDIVLRLALVMGLTVEDTQRMLRAADRGKLYPKVRRDAAILYALTHHISLAETDELLESLGEVTLLK